VAPPGNQAATEKTNINLYHAENPVYSPKVGHSNWGMQIAECGVGSKLKVPAYAEAPEGRQSLKKTIT